MKSKSCFHRSQEQCSWLLVPLAGDEIAKTLTITGLFFIILIVLGELLLPPVVESALEGRLSQKFSTPDVNVELTASPRLMLLLGRADTMAVTVKTVRSVSCASVRCRSTAAKRSLI